MQVYCIAINLYYTSMVYPVTDRPKHIFNVTVIRQVAPCHMHFRDASSFLNFGDSKSDS